MKGLCADCTDMILVNIEDKETGKVSEKKYKYCTYYKNYCARVARNCIMNPDRPKS